MDNPKEKLDKIAQIWDGYILKYKFCQSFINFNDETKTNYFADILMYFNDTFALLEYKNLEKSYQSRVFHTIGLLQTIYVQQDFIEELLYIFKFDKDKLLANDGDRNINRAIRNELVGHPIRRAKDRNNALISSVIFGNKLDESKISYAIYKNENNFEGIDIEHNIQEVVNRHIRFLNRYLDEIDTKTMKILQLFKNKILEVDRVLESKKDFVKLINFLEQQFEYIFKTDYLYKKSIILNIYERRFEHRRYDFALNSFIAGLKTTIKETISDINERIGEISDTQEINSNNHIIKGELQDYFHIKNYDYELSKLFDRHPIYNVRYFRDKFSNNKNICEELENMEKHIDSILEYYCSYQYISILIRDSELL